MQVNGNFGAMPRECSCFLFKAGQYCFDSVLVKKLDGAK